MKSHMPGTFLRDLGQMDPKMTHQKMEMIYARSNMSRTREYKPILRPGIPDPHVIHYPVVAPLSQDTCSSMEKTILINI